MAKPKIFVSHSSFDTAFAELLVHDLNAAGAEAWMDLNDMTAGSFPQRISEALEACEWFLLVLTHNALASAWVRQEVETAIVLKNQGQIHDLIFVKAEDVDLKLPALWRVFHYVNATADYGDALAKTLRDIGLSPVVAIPTRATTNGARPTEAANRAQGEPPLGSQATMMGPAKHMHRYVTRGRKYLEEERYMEALEAFEKILTLLRVEKMRRMERSQTAKSTYNDLYRKASGGKIDALSGLERVEEAREARRAALVELPYPE